MFQVSLTNFGTKFANNFATYEQAVEFASQRALSVPFTAAIALLVLGRLSVGHGNGEV